MKKKKNANEKGSEKTGLTARTTNQKRRLETVLLSWKKRRGKED